MAYADLNRPPDARALAGATLLQVAIGALVITGLSGVAAPLITKKENPDAVNYPLPEIPPPPTPTEAPPEAPSTATPRSTEVFTPTPRNPPIGDPVRVPGTEVPQMFEGPLDLNRAAPTGTPGPAFTPTPAPQPSFKPIGPAPRNNPGSWVTTADYPSISIRREEEGVVRFTLAISASGRVENCTVSGSSGHARLDRATCQKVRSRAKFDPAKDSSGKPIASSFTSEVVWQIP